MPLNAIYLGVFWLFYYAIHSALASDRVKLLFAQRMPGIYNWYRLFFSLFAGINFALLLWFHAIAPSEPLFRGSLILQISGLLVGIAALFVFISALRQYELRFWFRPSEHSESVLVTTGLNAVVRHPLYFAIILGLIALILIFPNWKNLIFAIVTTLYIIIGALLEEKKLISKFGAAYIAYRKRVKMLIPYII